MTAAKILKELKSLGSESYKKVMLKHGAKEPFFGVKIEDLKKIQRRVKQDHQLALDLYATGISDAMYLAGLIADDSKMTKRDLQRWVEQANTPIISEYTVPWVAAESPHGRELALRWIESKQDSIAIAGWATLASLVSIREDEDLDIEELKRLLGRVQQTIQEQPDRVRLAMNNFVIAVGSYVRSLTSHALETAEQIGPISADMGDTACKIPYAPDYIKKVQQRGALGKKRKSAKC